MFDFSLILSTLHVIPETVSSGYFPETLDLFSILVVVSGIAVITSKSPIVSVLFLIVLFSLIASYLIVSGFSFIGLSYIIVYVGAVSILFLFILMLIDIRISELQNNPNNSIALSVIVGVYLHFIWVTMPSSLPPFGGGEMMSNNFKDYAVINKNYFEVILSYFIDFIYRLVSIVWDITENIVYHVSSKAWDSNIASDSSHITSIGNIMYTNYSLWLILTSLILLLALVGAIIITINPQSSLKSHSFTSLPSNINGL